MHPIGKVLLGFVLIGCAAAGYMASRTLHVKQAWMRRVEEREQQLADITRTSKANQSLKDAREAELQREMLGWDRYWNNVRLNVANVDPKTPPTIVIGIGSDKGLTPKQRVFLFAEAAPAAEPAADSKPAETPPADKPAEGGEKPADKPAEGAGPVPAKPAADPAAGGKKYLGMFVVTSADADRSSLAPDERFTPERLAALTSGTCRVRTLIPTEYEQYFTKLEQQFLVLDETIAANQADIQRHEEQRLVAEEELASRRKEIEGDPAMKGRTLPPEHIDGLLATLATEEEGRNSALELVKSLQTRLKDTVERTAEIRTQLVQLVQSLPQPREQQARKEGSPR